MFSSSSKNRYQYYNYLKSNDLFVDYQYFFSRDSSSNNNNNSSLAQT